MGTNSTIAVVHQDNSVSQIYCHWDGYLSCNGKLLMQHYPTLSQAEELVSFGGMSSLRENIHPDPMWPHDFDNDQKNVCVFYGRDRGDEFVETLKYANIQDFLNERLGEEFDYIYYGDRWYLMVVDGKEQTHLLEVTQELIDQGEKAAFVWYLEKAVKNNETKLLTGTVA